MRYSVCRRCGQVAAVNSDELCYVCIRRGQGVHTGEGTASDSPAQEVSYVKRRALTLLAVVGASLAVVSNALAVTVPTIPVSTYGNALLDGLADAVTAVLPYAAAVTAFAIGVGMIRRWLGAKKATRV